MQIQLCIIMLNHLGRNLRRKNYLFFLFNLNSSRHFLLYMTFYLNVGNLSNGKVLSLAFIYYDSDISFYIYSFSSSSVISRLFKSILFLLAKSYPQIGLKQNISQWMRLLMIKFFFAMDCSLLISYSISISMLSACILS